MFEIRKRTKFVNTYNRITKKKIFLYSILSWYHDRVHCYIEKISEVFKGKFSNVQGDKNIAITIKIADMEKCGMKELDAEGKPIQEENAYGEKQDKIIVGDATGKKYLCSSN